MTPSEPLKSILDVPMFCPLCGSTTTAGEAKPDADGDGSLGCPVEDCGGILQEYGR